jgi:hypothetical protein
LVNPIFNKLLMRSFRVTKCLSKFSY